MLKSSSTLIASVCCTLNLAFTLGQNSEDASTNWIPNTLISNSTSKLTFAQPVASATMIWPRVFLDNSLQPNDYEYADQNEIKDLPFYSGATSTGNETGNELLQQSRPSMPVGGSNQAGLNTNPGSSSYFPQTVAYQTPHIPSHNYGAPATSIQPSQSYRVPSRSYGVPSFPFDQEYHYPASQNLPSQHIEFDQSSANFTFQINTDARLYVQPSKCSNSIQVGHIRNVEVKSTIKYGVDSRSGICVLMLYSANELNKLAVSLQTVQGTTNMTPESSWLQTNIKVYSVSGDNVQATSTSANFGLGSPALILSKSNIVLLSFPIEQAVNFFIDISTYQSNTC